MMIKHATKKILSMTLAVLLAVGMLPITAQAAENVIALDTLSDGDTGTGWSCDNQYSGNNYLQLTLNGPGPFVLTGTVQRLSVLVDNPTVQIILRDASINNPLVFAIPMNCNGNEVDLMLEGTNTLQASGATGTPALRVAAGSSLTIGGSGSLTSHSDLGSAGIEVDGNSALTITGDAEVTASGAENAGIGGSDCGTITISGNARVIATGSSGFWFGGNGAGIGGNNGGNGGTVIISDNAWVSATGGPGSAGIGGGPGGDGGNVIITGGTVTANANGGGAGIGGGSGGNGGDVTISGGNVNASSIQSTPTDGNGHPVYLGTLPNQPGVTSVSVDEVPYWIDANHDGDNNLYLYMTGENHVVDVEIGSTIIQYKATWDGAVFTWDGGTAQGVPEQTEVSLTLSHDTIVYEGGIDTVTATARVRDDSLGTRSLNAVDFYLGSASEPFASAPVKAGEATAQLDISGWNMGDYTIRAEYGGSFGGEASHATAALSIVPLTIDAQPTGQTVTEGSAAAFTVTATGSGPFSYQWQETADGTIWNNISGATSDTYTIPATTTAMSGNQYRVVVSNSQGDVTSDPATLTVNSYGVSLSHTGTFTFPPITENESLPMAETVTITNPGNQPTGSLSIALSGTNGNDFSLSPTTITDIAAGARASFTVEPTNSAQGIYTATVTVSGSNSISESFDVSFTVNSASAIITAPSITTTSLPNGTIGLSYSQTLDATGDTPITWSIDSGDLPNGLSLSSDGIISGSPTTAEMANFTVKAENGAASDDTKQFSITIDAPHPETPGLTATTISLNFGNVTTGTVSQPISLGISGTDLTGDITYSISGDTSVFSLDTSGWNSTTGGTLKVTFEPTAAVPYNADLTFSSSGATPVTVSLTGTGVSGTGGGDTGGGTTSRSRSDRDSGSTYTAPPAPIAHTIDAAEMRRLIATASANGWDFVRFSSILPTTVKADAWKLLAGYKFVSRLNADNAVQAQITFPEPTKLTTDMQVSGYVSGSIVDSRRAFFERWFTNKVQIVHFEQSGAWGQPVEVAVKVDLTGMDVKNLVIYSYDKTTNSYKHVATPNAWVDKNGYLHFTTQLAGDIVISEDVLEKK